VPAESIAPLSLDTLLPFPDIHALRMAPRWLRLTSASSQNPLTAAFWLGTTDARPLAFFRIALGVAMLHDLVDFSFDLRAFLTDDGMLPRSVARAGLTWSVFDLVGSPVAVAVVYAIGVAAVVAFTVGYRTRIATAISWVFFVSLHHRNYYVTDAGDLLTGILLFYSFFAEPGARLSIDSRMGRGGRDWVPAFPVRLLQAHIAILYFVSARLKWRMGWLHGVAIYSALQLDGFARPAGAWLATHPSLCSALTFTVVAMEAAFPFLAFSPVLVRPCRAGAVALGVALQLGLLLTMRMGIFTEVMLAVCTLYLQPEWLDRAGDWLGARGWVAAGRARNPPEAPGPSSILAVYAALGLQLVLANWAPFAGRRFPLPRVVDRERDALDLEQPYDLFGTTYEVPRWDAPGLLADGTPVEVLSVAAPGARARGPAIHYSRWNKYTFKWREHPLRYAELGAYLCRAYEERTHARLASFDLIDDESMPHLPGQPANPTQHKLLWHQECADAAAAVDAPAPSLR
jgi:hypothetical protein